MKVFEIFQVLVVVGSCFPGPGNPYVYTSYQTSIYCNATSEIIVPTDANHLIDLVKTAIYKGQTVKAIGSQYSISDVICTEGVPISTKNVDYAFINEDGTATFGAGITLNVALQFLESHNLSLINVPTFGGISLGGAIGTGSASSSLLHPATISDQVLRMNVIIGNGSLIEISGDELDIFRVNLGLLGVIVDVTLQTVPIFKMTIENRPTDESILFDGSIPLIAPAYDMFQLYWFPHSGHVVVGTGNYTTVEAEGEAYTNFIPDASPLFISTGRALFEKLQKDRDTEGLNDFTNTTEASLYEKVLGKEPIYTEDGSEVLNPATGVAWRLQNNLCATPKNILSPRCGWANGEKSIFPEESSMGFDMSQFSGVMNMIRDVLRKHPASFPLIGIFIRFAKASPGVMAISSGRDSFIVEWSTPMRNDPFETSRDGIGAYQAILQEMVTNYGGRPRWDKNGLYYFSEPVLSRAVPNRKLFVDAMRKYDPNGNFLNKFGRRMLGISDAQDQDPRVTHCAIQDYCICSKHDDCGPSELCGKINGFPVCLYDAALNSRDFNDRVY